MHDFVFGTPGKAQLAIAWFLPLITAAVGAAGSLFAPSAPKSDPNAYKLGAGLPGGSVDAPYFNFTEELAKLQGQPSAADPYLQQEQQFRDQQLALAQTLGQTASGQGPSLAKALVEQQRQKALAANMGVVASQPGRGNVALSQRLAAQGGQAVNASAIEQGRLGQLQEIFNAQSQLGTVLGQGRAGDVASGGLATQSEAQRRAAIEAILRMAMQREATGADLSARGEAARVAAGDKQNAIDKALVGSIFGGVGAATGAAISPAAPTAGYNPNTNYSGGYAAPYNPGASAGPWAPGIVPGYDPTKPIYGTTPGPWAPKPPTR